ncbi:MAG: hypothetical protein U0514_02745 [Candidatus Andersenbacteria bacterium]
MPADRILNESFVVQVYGRTTGLHECGWCRKGRGEPPDGTERRFVKLGQSEIFECCFGKVFGDVVPDLAENLAGRYKPVP